MSRHVRRLRNVSRASGAFVLAAALVLVGVLLLTARAQRWLEPRVAFTVRLPEAGTFGLRAGSSVELLGTAVGAVDEVRLDADGVLWASISMRADFARFVCADSPCLIKKRTLDLAGDAYLEIGRGSAAPCAAGSTLSAEAARGLTDAFNDVVQGLGRELMPATSELRDAVREYADLARTLRNPAGGLQQALARLESVARRAEEGQGLVGRLLLDEGWPRDVDHLLRSMRELVARLDEVTARLGSEATATARSVNELAGKLGAGEHSVTAVVGDLRGLLADLQPILADLARAAATLPEVAAALRAEVRALPGLVQQSRQMMAEIESVAAAAARHWLLAPYVAPSAPTERVGDEGLRR